MHSSPDRRALRVAHLIESDGPGGAERVVAHVATALQRSGGYNVVFVPAAGEGWLGRQLEESGVAVERFRLDRPVSLSCARSLAAAFRRHGIDIAHSHEFSMAVYGACAAWLSRIPHVITMHGNRYYAGRLQRRIALRAAIAYSGRVVAVSRQLADALCRDLRVRRARIDVVPNGVSGTAGEARLRTELGLGPADRLLVCVGNLYPVKGHRYLIEATAQVSARHPTLHLAIAGRGDLDASLAGQARGHGLAERVHLLGLRSDIPALLSSADLFVLPSLSEGLPLALLEAMFAGCPIVASQVGDIAAALADGECGALVPPGDAAALAQALDRLLADPAAAAALGERARLRAVAEYDVSRMVGRYRSMYDQLLGCERIPVPVFGEVQ